jgi:hypothetical protein
MLVEQLLLFLIVCGNSIEIMRDICEKFGGLMKMIVMMKKCSRLRGQIRDLESFIYKYEDMSKSESDR